MDSGMFMNIILALSLGGNVVLLYTAYQYDKTLESAQSLILHLLHGAVVEKKEVVADESN